MKYVIIIIILLLKQILIKEIFAINYCQYTVDHLLCNYDGKISPDCISQVKITNKLTYKQIRIILDSHNEYRRKVAKGQDGFYNASDMRMMVGILYIMYDAEILQFL